MCLQYKSFENTVGNGETAHNKQFLFFQQCFPLVWRTFCHYHQILNGRLHTLWVWKSLKFVIWKTVNLLPDNKILDWSKLKQMSDNILTNYNTMPDFDSLKIYSCRKEKLLVHKQFFLFSQCFLPYMVLFHHFKCTLKCRLQFVSIRTSLKFCHLVKR